MCYLEWYLSVRLFRHANASGCKGLTVRDLVLPVYVAVVGFCVEVDSFESDNLFCSKSSDVFLEVHRLWRLGGLAPSFGIINSIWHN